VALIHSEATVRSTGRKVVDDAAHLWTFRDGKVARFQVFQDTAALVAAFSEG
jgi:ketosteroid isomerase-like protein